MYITYEQLFQLLMLIADIVTIFVSIYNNKKK